MSDAQIKSFFQRWERLEAEKKELGELLKDLFAEAKSVGYETKALRAAFRLKAKQDLDSPADAEFEAVVDTYLDALNGSSRATRAYARENIEQFDPATGEIIEADASAKLVETIAAGAQTEVGRAALIAAVDIMIEREEAEETQERPSTNDEASPEAGPQAEASPAGTGAGTLADREGRREGEAASVGLPTSSEFTSDERETDREAADTLAGANAGGGYVKSSAERARNAATNVANAAESVTAGETATNSIAKPRSVLRPHCLNPGENCGGYGDKHCHSCLKALRESQKAEEVA